MQPGSFTLRTAVLSCIPVTVTGLVAGTLVGTAPIPASPLEPILGSGIQSIVLGTATGTLVVAAGQWLIIRANLTPIHLLWWVAATVAGFVFGIVATLAVFFLCASARPGARGDYGGDMTMIIVGSVLLLFVAVGAAVGLMQSIVVRPILWNLEWWVIGNALTGVCIGVVFLGSLALFRSGFLLSSIVTGLVAGTVMGVTFAYSLRRLDDKPGSES